MTEKPLTELPLGERGISLRAEFLIYAAIGIFALSIALVPSCAKTPPNLSPAAATAFQSHQIQQALDVIRDVAVDANDTTPPLLNTATTRTVVTWHQSAIVILHARAQGWQGAVLSTIEELQRNLPPQAIQIIGPYLVLARTLLQVPS